MIKADERQVGINTQPGNTHENVQKPGMSWIAIMSAYCVRPRPTANEAGIT
jgi:hypothetical protein